MPNAQVDFIINRAKNILTKPQQEWDKIEGEKPTIKDLYLNYILILSALPAIGAFVKGALYGYSIMGVTYRVPIAHALGGLIGSYILGLLGLAALAFVVDFLAPKFGGQSNQINAFKLCTYSMTAGWLAGGCLLIPVIGGILSLAGLYSLYLFYLGVPKLMKAPQSQAGIFTVVAIVVAAVVMAVISIALPVAHG